MTFDQSRLLLSTFAAFVAWGFAVRLAPFLWHLANAFLIGSLFTILVLLWLTLTTSRGAPAPSPSLRLPVPAFILPQTWQFEKNYYLHTLQNEPIALHRTSSQVSDDLGQLIDLALRSFITSWYRAVSPSPAFVAVVDRNIRHAILQFRDRLEGQDLVNLLVSRVVPLVTEHVREFDNAERALRARATNRTLPDSEELDLAIAAKYKDGRLHPAVAIAYADTKTLQQDHLRKLLSRILPPILDEAMLQSRAVAVLVKEIVACAVLEPIIQSLTDPDTWNQLVEAYGRTTLQDRKTVRRMRAALDEHTITHSKRQAPAEIPRLQPHDSERAFEKFVRAIRKTKTLPDARRFRNQIASQLARERLVEGQDPVFLRRLEMGKRVLDQKISKMTASEHGSADASLDRAVDTSSKSHTWTLAEIMHTASGLSYLMEFMERQGKMILVQFWVVVDGFRNPLEDDFGDERSTATVTWTDTDRLDIAQIAENYLTKMDLNVPHDVKEAVQVFLQAGRHATPEQYREARMAVLSSQSAVQEDLEQNYLPKFRESDLYYKFLASDEGQASQRSQAVSINGVGGARAAPVFPKLQSPSMSRSSSQVAISKAKDLRRAAMSSSDIKGLSKPKHTVTKDIGRKSLDSDRPLFDDDFDIDPLANSVQSIGNDSAHDDFQAEPEVIENMEAALTNIMADEPSKDLSDSEQDALFSPNRQAVSSQRPSLEASRNNSAAGQKQKPSLATLGLVSGAGRIGVFQDNDLFGDEAKFAEDDYADHEIEAEKDVGEEIHQAAPGDLGLTEAITVLSDDIERLVSQETIVDALTRKAELTNNVAELRILSKSRASLQREIRRKELQRQQYIVQESDNSLYGRAAVNIESVMVGREDDGQEFALYIIKVQRKAGDQMPAASWAIAHRYSEFHELHQKLRRRYPSTRNLEFPRRRMVMKLQKQFLHNRRLALETYLRQLLRMPDVCRSREFRAFLSQQAIVQRNPAAVSAQNASTQDMVTRIYNSVTDGMDDFLGNIAVIDQLSTAGQNLISAATTQLNTTGTTSDATSLVSVVDDVIVEPGSIAEAEAELRAFEDRELAPFVKPICDIFLELFELNRGNNWLRGRAVVVVIHQLLGGTVERKIRDAYTALLAEDSLVRFIEMAKNIMWPHAMVTNPDTGETTQTEERELKKPSPPRSKAQKDQSRREAATVLGILIPELAGSVVGRSNAQVAAKRISTVMNNKRLNEHLIYTILDEIIAFLFEDVGLGINGNGMRVKSKAQTKSKVRGGAS